MAYYVDQYDASPMNVLPGGKAGVALAVGDLVYMDASGLWQKADSVDLGDTTRKDALGVMIQTASANEYVNPVRSAIIRGYSGLTIGSKQYLSATAGAVTAIEPTTTVRQQVGFAETAAKINFAIGGAGGAPIDVGGDVTCDTLTAAGITSTAAITGSSTSASALAVGANGATNPVIKINANTASVATGIEVTGAAAAGGVAVAAISSGANETISLDGKGTGGVNIATTSTGDVLFGDGTNPAFKVDHNAASAATGIAVTAAAAASGVALAAVSSGTDEHLTIDAKGADTVDIATISTGGIRVGTSSADLEVVKGIYAANTVAVTVPSISDNDTGEVAVDVSAAFTFQPAVGDAVIAIPEEALPTDCSLAGAWVSATDTVTISFTAQDGAVTGAAKNFTILVIDLT